jgi:hypothetical protein
MAVAIGLFVIDTLLPSSIGAAVAGASFLGISGAAWIGYTVIGAPPVGLCCKLRPWGADDERQENDRY